MTALDSASTADCFRRCERIVRDRARNFWYGLRLTPEPKRSAMYAVYAWMRAADDIADDATSNGNALDADSRAARLARFRADTDRALAGDVPLVESDGTERARDRQSMWRAMAAIAPTYHLDRKDFHDMLDGQLADLGHVRIATWGELREQCYRVASTVGLVCLRVWGLAPEAGAGRNGAVKRAETLAIERGIAFQLTNILRDVREDFEAGRVYVPQADFAAHGLTIESLLAWKDDARCQRFVREQVARAVSHYTRSDGLESLISPECMPTLWAMSTIYRGLLDRIGEDPRAIVGPRRVRLATWEKLWIGYRARRLAMKCRPATTGVAAEVATP